MDPRALKSMMAKMGIKSSEVSASRVVIETGDKNIVITNPQVTRIEAQGNVSFQIAGDVQERVQIAAVEITEDDIKMVMERTGVTDRDRALKALQAANGDIAQAIIVLKG